MNPYGVATHINPSGGLEAIGEAIANSNARINPTIHTRFPRAGAAAFVLSKSLRLAFMKASAPTVIRPSPLPINAWLPAMAGMVIFAGGVPQKRNSKPVHKDEHSPR